MGFSAFGSGVQGFRSYGVQDLAFEFRGLGVWVWGLGDFGFGFRGFKFIGLRM